MPRSRSDNPESASPDPDHRDVQAPVAGSQAPDPLVRALQDALAMQQVEPFNGKSSSKAAEFLTQLRHVFKTTSLGIKSDEEKVDYAISRLRDKAHAWAQAYRDKVPTPAWLSDFDLFATELTTRFGKPRNARNVVTHLRSLRQTGSVADYAIEFQQDAAILGWPDETLIDQFERGLKDAVLDELVRVPEPTDLESYIQLAIRIDNRLQQRANRRGREPPYHLPSPKKFHPRGQPVPSTSAPSTPSRGFAPASSRDAGTRPQARTTTQPKFRQLTDQEKEHRRKNNLCMYCADPNHVVSNCPQCPSNRHGPARAFGATRAASDLPGNFSAQLQ